MPVVVPVQKQQNYNLPKYFALLSFNGPYQQQGNQLKPDEICCSNKNDKHCHFAGFVLI